MTQVNYQRLSVRACFSHCFIINYLTHVVVKIKTKLAIRLPLHYLCTVIVCLSICVCKIVYKNKIRGRAFWNYVGVSRHLERQKLCFYIIYRFDSLKTCPHSFRAEYESSRQSSYPSYYSPLSFIPHPPPARRVPLLFHVILPVHPTLSNFEQNLTWGGRKHTFYILCKV